jgi:hypothetical protein
MSRFFSSIRFVLILFLGFNNGNYASFDVEKDLIKIADSNLKGEKTVEGPESYWQIHRLV